MERRQPAVPKGTIFRVIFRGRRVTQDNVTNNIGRRPTVEDQMGNINHDQFNNRRSMRDLDNGDTGRTIPPVVFEMNNQYLNTDDDLDQNNPVLIRIVEYIRATYRNATSRLINGKREVVISISDDTHPLWNCIRYLNGKREAYYHLTYRITYRDGNPIIHVVSLMGTFLSYTDLMGPENKNNDDDQDERERDKLHKKYNTLSKDFKNILTQINNGTGSSTNQQPNINTRNQLHDIKRIVRILESRGAMVQAEKIVYKTLEKHLISSKAALKLAVRALEKVGVKISAKLAANASKSFTKKIPIIGTLFGAGFGTFRAFQGDWTGAGLEVASGFAGIFPGVGTAASAVIDASLVGIDLSAEQKEVQKRKEKAQKEYDEALEKFQESEKRVEESKEVMKNETAKMYSLLGMTESKEIISMDLINQLKAINEEMEEIENKILEIQDRMWKYRFFLLQRYLDLDPDEYHSHFQAFYRNCKPQEFIEELNNFVDSIPTDGDYSSKILESVAILFIIPTRFVLRKNLSKILKKTKFRESQIQQVIEYAKFHENNKLKLMTEQVGKQNYFYLHSEAEDSVVIVSYKNIVLSSKTTDQFITASRAVNFETETFKIDSLEDGYVTIQRSDDCYLSATGTTGDSVVFLKKQNIGETEKFKLEDWGFDRMSLKASNGLYLGVASFSLSKM